MIGETGILLTGTLTLSVSNGNERQLSAVNKRQLLQHHWLMTCIDVTLLLMQQRQQQRCF